LEAFDDATQEGLGPTAQRGRISDRSSSTLKAIGRAWIGALILATLASGCSGYDSDYIPYALGGFDVWFYDERPSCDDVNEDDEDEESGWCREGESEVYLGRVEANYLSRTRGLSDCNAIAVAEANRRNVSGNEWGYVCCTVTASSDCVTKVR
jgi:hypothetical protein